VKEGRGRICPFAYFALATNWACSWFICAVLAADWLPSELYLLMPVEHELMAMRAE